MSSSVRAYNLSIPDEFAAYLEIWRSGQSRRPHDHPQYMLLMRVGQQEPHAIVYFEVGVPKIIYPFYLVRLIDLTGFESDSCFSHMVSAYGYGGSVRLSDELFENLQFEKELDIFFRENRIISEFVREDLFDDYKVQRRFSSEKQQDNVVVNLTRTPDILWKEYKHAVRKNVNRATTSKLKVVFDFNGAMVEQFVNIYHMTMMRTGAKEDFLITADMFKSFNFFLNDGIGFYVHVLCDECVIATELVLSSPRYLYSFLGGADINYSNLRPSDYLKHQVNTWGIEKGYCGYVLGGGFKPYDGIYSFKLAFDLSGARPFFIQKNIHNDVAYTAAIEARRCHEQSLGNNWEPGLNFFPAFLQW